MHTHWTDRLSEYQDGELSSADRAACEAHLAVCETCEALLEEIRAVIAVAARDPDVAPRVDLWPGIVARIDESHSAPAPVLRGPWYQRRISLGIPQLALAATLLIAVSAVTAYLAAGRVVVHEPIQESAVVAVAEPTLPPSAELTPASFADAQFDRAVADLERILREQRDDLDPGTVMVIKRNLETIDQAIREARSALEADPANPFLNSHLAAARRRKLDLLRHATTMAGD